MREPTKPSLDGLSELEAMQAFGDYAERLLRYQAKQIDSLPDRKQLTTDGPKTLTNTAHDKQLSRAKTIHDVIAEKPQFLKELEAIFGKRVIWLWNAPDAVSLASM